jgi:hypothetical protein
LIGVGVIVTAAEQDAFVPPFDPLHTHSQELPLFATVEEVPTEQRLVAGAVAKD